MLENLYLNPSENNKKKIISKSFNSKRGFESRLLMLKDNKFINYKNNVINLTAKGKWLLKIIKFIQNILLIN
jgi:predicted transcriptional regulator